MVVVIPIYSSLMQIVMMVRRRMPSLPVVAGVRSRLLNPLVGVVLNRATLVLSLNLSTTGALNNLSLLNLHPYVQHLQWIHGLSPLHLQTFRLLPLTRRLVGETVMALDGAMAAQQLGKLLISRQAFTDELRPASLSSTFSRDRLDWHAILLW
jgi:hypothetical protein